MNSTRLYATRFLQRALLVIVILVLGITASQAAIREHLQTNAIDVVVFTAAAKIVNDCLLQHSELSLEASICYGAGSWLCGEIAETVCKKIYKILIKQNLRAALGASSVFGVEIDHQRLMRRLVTLIPLFVQLYQQKYLVDFIDT